MVDVSEIQRLTAAQRYDEAKSLVTKFKLEYLPLLSSKTPPSEEQKSFAREGLQQAVLVSLGLKDMDSFSRHMSQLRPLYSIKEPCRPNDPKALVTGLYLMFLLVENRLAEFHSELELLSEDERQIDTIAFPIKLEQFMMVGAFNQVLEAKASMPSETFHFFMASIVETVRDSVAECAQAAYNCLSLAAAQNMLMIESRAELMEFIAQKEWIVEGDTIAFQPASSARSAEVPSMRLLSESLAYATELERIV